MSVIEETTLVYVAARENSNKFYKLELHSDGTVRKQWGRVGAAGQQQTVAGGAGRYHATISEKERKGYRRVATSAAATLPAAAAATIAKTALRADVSDSQINDLIERIAQRNRHNIAALSGGRIHATTGGVSTALGPITGASVARARALLGRIQHAIDVGDPHVSLLEDYLSLVPQKVSGRAGWEQRFLASGAEVAAQWTLLDALESAIEVPTDPGTAQPFRYRISRLENQAELKRVRDLFARTRNAKHGQTRDLRVKAVYVLADCADGQAAYDRRLAMIGGERRLWHGTPAGNVLSILAGGLTVPRSASHGRMFGNGVYLADQSSKATGYSGTGVWGAGADEDHFVFLADVALGRALRPTSRSEAIRACGGTTYNSVVVAGGTCGVRNSETIVWDTDQVSLRYLIELH